MAFELGIFKDPLLQADYIEWLVDERAVDIQTHFAKLWEYYANRMESGSSREPGHELGRCYLQAQEYGLPARITGLVHSTNAGWFCRLSRQAWRKDFQFTIFDFRFVNRQLSIVNPQFQRCAAIGTNNRPGTD